jgi:Tfp pilus assembly protein PilV
MKGTETGSSARSPRGLSLIEVIFAATLIGMLMIFLICLFPSSVMAIRHAEHRIKALHLAQSYLEEKRYGAFSELYAAPEDLYDVMGDDGTVYHPCDYECFDIYDADPAHLKGIRVTVTWKETSSDYSITQELHVFSLQR